MPPQSPLIEAALAEAISRHQAGDLSSAGTLYKELLDTHPDHPDLWHLLGVIAHQQNDPELAKTLIGNAIALKDDAADYHNNLGMVNRRLGADDDAETAFRHAVRLNPSHARALANLAALLRGQGEFSAALEYARRAARAAPDDSDVLTNLGNAEKDGGLVEDAVETYRRAVALDPAFALGHWNLSLALLALGAYPEGFAEMGWRWKWKGFPAPRRNFDQPLWTGTPAKTSTLFLHAEQGLGDAIHFVRYGALARPLVNKVILEVPAALADLARRADLADEVIAQGDPLPDFDIHAPFLDLPGIFETTLKTVPGSVPYLTADPQAVQSWRDRLTTESGDRLKIGLNWRGNADSPVERFRRVPPNMFAPLAAIESCAWYSLQKGEDGAPASELPAALAVIDSGPSPLSESAALIQALDLVITTDTALAHLAGALGKPVWLLLHHAPDWRWGLAGPDCPWYPTARLFRQTTPGDWATVIDALAQALPAFDSSTSD